MLGCTKVGPIPDINNANYGPLVTFLCKMIETATLNAPVWPVPVYRTLEDEISLEDISLAEILPQELPASDCISHDSLSFDGEDGTAETGS